jgi:hypothetical protein
LASKPGNRGSNIGSSSSALVSKSAHLGFETVELSQQQQPAPWLKIVSPWLQNRGPGVVSSNINGSSSDALV